MHDPAKTLLRKSRSPVRNQLVLLVGAMIVVNFFTPDDVVKLDRFQREANFHPFTCPDRDDERHRVMGGDLGALVPTVRGWICPFCNYTQNWYHAEMVCE